MKNLISGENIVLPNACIRLGIHIAAATPVEVDLLALPLSSSGLSISSESIVNLSRKYIKNGTIILDGHDNDWRFEINLPFLPIHWNRILFALLFDNTELAQPDQQLIVTIEQIAKFIIPGGELSGLSAIRLGEIYRHQHTYKFRAFGDGYHAGVEQVARSHGIDELPQIAPDRPGTPDPIPGSGRENFLGWLFGERPVTFKAAMIGPQSAGKTSLLAGMYDQLNRINRLSPMKLTVDAESAAELKKHVQQMIHQPWARAIQSWPEVAETADLQLYNFQLTSTVADFQITLQINDPPGRYLQQQPEQMIDLIRTSQIILLVIDAPALLTESGRWHETVNAGRQLTDFFKRALQDIDAPKLLLIAPVRCECYLQRHEDQPLLAAIHKEYAGLINVLGRMKKDIAVAITPVQTLGGVHFIGCSDQEKPTFLFEKRPDMILYSPRDVEQPLLYSLSFMLRGLMGSHRRFLKNELREHLEEVIGDFLQYRKQGAEGYQILQGARLL